MPGRSKAKTREAAPRTGGSWTWNPEKGEWLKTGTAVQPAGEIDTPTEELNDGTDS